MPSCISSGRRGRRHKHLERSHPSTTRWHSAGSGRRTFTSSLALRARRVPLTCDIDSWRQFPLMRTTAPAYSRGIRLSRSRGRTAAKTLRPETSTACVPRAGIKVILAFTFRPSGDSAPGASGGYGGARASSSPSPTSSGDRAVGPSRETFAQTNELPGYADLVAQVREHLRHGRARARAEGNT